jgi:hypothetical protein
MVSDIRIYGMMMGNPFGNIMDLSLNYDVVVDLTHEEVG